MAPVSSAGSCLDTGAGGHSAGALALWPWSRDETSSPSIFPIPIPTCGRRGWDKCPAAPEAWLTPSGVLSPSGFLKKAPWCWPAGLGGRVSTPLTTRLCTQPGVPCLPCKVS